MISLLIRDLSIGRAQIAIEQIRRVADVGQQDRLVILTTSEIGQANEPLAAVVAVLQKGLGDGVTSDVAAVVHAGRLRDLDGTSDDSIIASLSTALDNELRVLGVNFVHWATDEVKMGGSPPLPSTSWCDRFGFQPIGTLDYLCGPVPSDPTEPFCFQPSAAPQNRPLRFHSVSWDNSDHREDLTAFDQLVRLVDRTYANTLDCPALSEFRSPLQVLEGYRTSEAFDQSLWFAVTEPNRVTDLNLQDTDEREVGCVILATHQSAESSTNDTQVSTGGSVEIVYMGLVPEARGNGFGKQLVQKSFDVAREIGADQVLLAVDQINDPAKSIYQLAGLKPIVHETIWVKSIASKIESEK